MKSQPSNFDARHPRMSRREAIKWMVAATATASVLQGRGLGATRPAVGYGTDPNLMDFYKPGDLWPLTFTPDQRRTVAALCDVIIPADDKSPSASQLHVPDFIDEWVSAPYPGHPEDKKVVLNGLAWLDAESKKRFRKQFADLNESQQNQICEDICYVPKAKSRFERAAQFFALMRNLTASGFYTTAEGMKDLDYIGNVALTKFDGPPAEVLAYLKLG
jgi:hypothetical protein